MGLPADRIVSSDGTSTDLITCLICHDILWKPVTCESCENSFCTAYITACLGINNTNVCPNNCEYRQRQLLPLLLVQLLSKLKLTCENNMNRCQEVLAYESLEQHQLHCGFEMKQCKGCRQTMLKMDLDGHEDQCGEIELECRVCKGKYQRKDGHNGVECLQNCLIQQQQRTLALQENGREQRRMIDELQKRIEVLEGFHNRRVIQFDNIPGAKKDQVETIMNFYSGFKWYNFRYMHISRAIAYDQVAAHANAIVSCHTNAFTYGQEYLASLNLTNNYPRANNLCYYNNMFVNNSIGDKTRITTENFGETFNIHSFNATSFMPVMIKLTVAGLRYSTELFQKEVHLTNKSTEIILD